MTSRTYILFLIFITLFSINCLSQNQHKIDSLQAEMTRFEIHKKALGKSITPLTDSTRINILNEIGFCYFSAMKLDKSMELARQSLFLSEKSGYKKGISKACLRMGAICSMNHDFKETMRWYQKALTAAAEINNKELLAKIHHNMARACSDNGNYSDAKDHALVAVKLFLAARDSANTANSYLVLGTAYTSLYMIPEALTGFLASLAICEKTGNKPGAVLAYNNIAIIYSQQKKYPDALKNYLAGQKILKAMNDKAGLAMNYRNIGLNYYEEHKYAEALAYQFQALKISEELGDKDGIAVAGSLIGYAYSETGNYPDALLYLNRALVRFREIDSKTSMAWAENGIGVVLKKQGKLTEALIHIKKGLDLAIEVNYTSWLDEGYRNLAEINASQKNYKSAYENEVLFNRFHDSIYNTESTKKLAGLQLKYEFDKKQQADSIRHASENQINLLNLRKQKTYTGMGAAGLVLVILLLFFVYSNYSNQRKATAEMALARERAEQSEKFKQQFLANMSHEIRTPMNAVMGMTNLVLDTPLNEKQKFYLEGVRKSGETLLHIINDILDLSKIEAGKMELERIDFSLSEVLGQVKQTMQHKAEEKGLQLSACSDQGITDVLTGDPVRLNQVLINLTGNAIKFTEKGGVTISITQGHVKDMIRFSVTDTGIGIPQDKLQHVFESFAQANASDTRRYGGTGLGLTISKQFVELMGGEITIESKVDSGTTFSFEISCPAGSPERLKERGMAEEIDGHILDGLMVLLADDNEYNRIVTGDTLRSRARVEISEATNGKEAIELMKKKDFDLVLMDVQMPVMDGYEATRLIRDATSGVRDHRIPVIALTASVIRTDLDKCREAGMNDYVPKPFKTAHLISAMAKAIGREIRYAEKHVIEKTDATRVRRGMTNMRYLEKFCDGDKKRMQKYIQMFLDSAPVLISRIEAALDTGDHEEIARQMHGYKTKFLMMGMNETKDLAAEIEIRSREGILSDQLKGDLQSVCSQIRTAVTELK